MHNKDPLTFLVNYANNVECFKSQVPKDQQSEDFIENLPCNLIWDESCLQKFKMHINGYYESIEKMKKEPSDPVSKSVTYNENQLVNFFNVLIHEKVIFD